MKPSNADYIVIEQKRATVKNDTKRCKSKEQISYKYQQGNHS